LITLSLHSGLDIDRNRNDNGRSCNHRVAFDSPPEATSHRNQLLSE